MPLAFLIIGIAIGVTAFRGTYAQLGTLVANDFTGSNSFLVWLGAILAIGLIGYIPGLEKPSRLMIALLLLVVFLKNGGFFDKFKQAVSSAQPTAATSNVQQVSGPAPVQIQTTGSGGGGGLGSLIGAFTGGGGSPSAIDAVAGTGGLY